MSGKLSVFHCMLRSAMGYKGSMAQRPEGRPHTDVDKTDGKVDWDPISLYPGGYSKHNLPKGATKHYHYNKVVPFQERIPLVNYWDERRLGKLPKGKVAKVPATKEEAIANGADPAVIRAWGPYWQQSLQTYVPNHLVRHDYVKALTRTAGRLPINPEFVPTDLSPHISEKLGVTLNVNRYTVLSEHVGSFGQGGYLRGAKIAIFAFLFVVIWHTHFVDHRFPFMLDWRILDNMHDVAERERRMIRDGLTYEDLFKPSIEEE